jgi:hypothetical protein
VERTKANLVPWQLYSDFVVMDAEKAQHNLSDPVNRGKVG